MTTERKVKARDGQLCHLWVLLVSWYLGDQRIPRLFGYLGQYFLLYLRQSELGLCHWKSPQQPLSASGLSSAKWGSTLLLHTRMVSSTVLAYSGSSTTGDCPPSSELWEWGWPPASVFRQQLPLCWPADWKLPRRLNERPEAFFLWCK